MASFLSQKLTAKHTQSLQKREIFDSIESPTLENLLELFSYCKHYFCNVMTNKNRVLENPKKKNSNEDYQEQTNFIDQDSKALSIFQKIILIQKEKFHFNEQERQLVLQEGLSLCRSMIQKYESNSRFKKSKTIKRFLTKLLLMTSKFLVEKILTQTNLFQYDNLTTVSLFLLQPQSLKDQGQQKKHQIKKELTKNYQFEVPLMISNLKIPFSFHFIFSLLQQKIINIGKLKNTKKEYQYILDQIHLFCQNMLLYEEKQTASLLIKTVCQCLGVFQFPITYWFFSSILSIVEKQFTKKYKSLNHQNLLTFIFNRQLFSFKNFNLILSSLFHLQKGSFKQINLSLIKAQNYQNELRQQLFKCIQCDLATDKFILVDLVEYKGKQGQKNKNSLRRISLKICIKCFCGKNNIQQNQLYEEHFQQEKFEFLLKLFWRSFWRQQFQIQGLRKCKMINMEFISLKKGDKINVNNLSDKFISNIQGSFSQSEIASKCLKALYTLDLNYRKSNPNKSLNLSSLKLYKVKFITILIILLNSNCISLRQEAFHIMNNDFFSQFIRNHVTFQDIQRIIEEQEQQRFEQKEEENENSIKFKFIQLIQQVNKRLFDKSISIQRLSFKALLNIQKNFSSSYIKFKIFQSVVNHILRNLQFSYPMEKPIQMIELLVSEIKEENIFQKDLTIQDVVSTKYIVVKILGTIFKCLQTSSTQKSVFQGQEVRDAVYAVHYLLQSMTFLINYQSRLLQNKNLSQYQSLVIGYLKQYKFTSETILCFKLNDDILERLISLAQLEESSQSQQKQNFLLLNIRLILEQIFDFVNCVQSNQILSKSKPTKGNKKIKPSKVKDQNHHQNYQLKETNQHFKNQLLKNNFERPCCNLNKIIKNMIKDKKVLSVLNCEILFLLIQKNIFLNYESQSNVSDTPSKIKRLILSLQTIKQFKQILSFVENQIKQCNIQLLDIYIQLYVVICLQINEENKIQIVYGYYLNAFKYFKKSWLCLYEKYLNNQQQDTQDQKESIVKANQYLIRSLKTITLLATELQKFKKIQFIAEDYFSAIKKQKKNKNKYSIFSMSTQQAIRALQTDPQTCFVQAYQQMYAVLDLIFQKYLPKIFIYIVQNCLKMIELIIKVHPQLISKTLAILQHIPKKVDMSFQLCSQYLMIFESILSTKDSILISLLPNLFFRVQQCVWRFNQNQSIHAFQIFERMYKIAFYLLKQDVVGIHELIYVIYYGLFIKNKKVNQWTQKYIQYLNQKGNDSILLNNFQKTIIQVGQKLEKNNSSFFQDKQIFKNVKILGRINKETFKKLKVFLQKDLKNIKIRSSFIKKVSQLFSGSFDWLRFTDQSCNRYIFLILKIIEQFVEMDVYQLQELIYSMEKVIKEYYLNILQINHQYTPQQSQQSSKKSKQSEEIDSNQKNYEENSNIHLMAQKRRTFFIVGQIMFTLIKLLNQKKLKSFKKQLQKIIEEKKFTSFSIFVSVNQVAIKQNNSKNYETVLNYQDCSDYIKKLEEIFNRKTYVQYQQMKKNLLQLTKQFKYLVKKMYSVLFQDQKPRIIINANNQIKRNLPKNRNKKLYEDDEEFYSDSQYSDLSKENSCTKISNSNKTKDTKKINLRSNPDSRQDYNTTKRNLKGNENRKLISHSLPKKLEKRLSTISETNNDQELGGNFGEQYESKRESRRSKRLIQQRNASKSRY